MKLYARVVYVVLLSLVPHVISDNMNITQTCTHLYEKGVEAYLENNFPDCVTNFENALEKYRDYTQKLAECRLRCRQEAELSEPLYPVNVDNLLFFEQTVRTTLCIFVCKRKFKATFFKAYLNPETEKLFQDRKPYEYLHICYVQIHQPQKAASAAFTYLVAHPKDKIMSANLKHYSKMEGVDMNELINLEAKDYVYLYIHGSDAYDKKDWPGAVQNMEESLVSYLRAEEECRAQCEGPFDQGWLPDFVPAVANHFTFCLRCKQKCRSQLSSLNGEKHEDLLPSHYHYLQFAYFKQGNLRAACAAVASYLLFYPDDDTMLENMKYYRKLPKGNDDLFLPRPEAVHYVQRHMYEQRLLKFIVKQFNFREKPTEVWKEEAQYRVVMTEKELNGTNRFLSEGLASSRQCKSLVSIADNFAIIGDGYEGKKSPHTVKEKFEGVTIERATFLVYFGLLHHKYLDLYLQITNKAKLKVQEFFKIKKKLFFTYTHLVCRSALSDAPIQRADFSHPIHADNCNILKDNTCERLPPAYTWRDFSAIIYLNDNFKGGEFIFSKDPNAEQVQSTIEPKCGKMIAFSSGAENLHGVKAVTQGSRCAIGIWLTFDSKHVEIERNLAYSVLKLFRQS